MENIVKDETYILTHLPEVTDCLMRQLPMKTLNTCARVCKSWNESVKRIKKRRKQISWIFLNGNTHTEVDCVRNDLKNLSSEPHLALLFCTTEQWETEINGDGRPLLNFIEEILPHKCLIAGVLSEGIIGTSTDLRPSVEIENGLGTTCILFPNREDIDIYPFYHLHNVVSEDCMDRVKMENWTGVPAQKDVKLVLLFYQWSDVDLPKVFANAYKDIVIAGGNVDGVLPKDVELLEERELEPSGMGVAFCGDMLIASCLIKERVSTKAQVKKSLQKLKDAKLPEGNSFAFMIACVGRGRNVYRHDNVEADEFRKLFPNTPLFGVFGNGEIGHEHIIPVENETNLPTPKKTKLDTGNVTMETIPGKKGSGNSEIKLNHTYTTVFVLVSLAKK